MGVQTSLFSGWLKNGRRHFKLILSCFFSMFSPNAKFYPNRTKNTEVRNFHFWSTLVDWAGSSRNGGRHLKLLLCCFYLIISPHTKFHPNRMKNTEVENFHFWSILVGRAGRSKNGRSHFTHSESLKRLTNDLCTKFEPNRTKIGQVSPSWNFFPKIEIWLVGPVCMNEIGSRIRIQST